MARTRKAPAAEPTIPDPPPADYVIALSGKFTSFGHSHASLEKLVKTLGGTITRSVARSTTHLVCTEEEYNGVSDKVTMAKANSLVLVNPQWLVDCDQKEKLISSKTFEWGSTQPSEPAAKKRPASSSGGDATGAGIKKSRRGDAGTNADGIPQTQAEAAEASKVAPVILSQAQKDLKEKQAEREIAKQDKKMSVGQFMKKKNASVPVDHLCGLGIQNYTVFIDPDSGMIYDASLNQTHSSKNANKFYLIQVLVSPDATEYKTWTRWGRVGDDGQKLLLGDGSLGDALKQFEKKFRDKSGLPWAQRAALPKPGKYAFVERSYNPDDDDDDKNDDGTGEQLEDDAPGPMTSKLAPAVVSLMELIFDPNLLHATMNALKYNANKLPLGKLSKGNILRGYETLKNLAALLDDPSLAQTQYNMPFLGAVEQLSNMYYSIIPHAFGRNHPPIIRDKRMVGTEVDLLESLTDMKVADEIMKALKPGRYSSLADIQFASLGLEEMTVLDQSSAEFQLLKTYLCGSRGHTHSVDYKNLCIFRIERQGEKDRFDGFSKASKIGANRRLLWHGSRVANFGGILSQGLRIAPPEAPAHGTMFGKGIYLADMSSKSAGYCLTGSSGRQGLLLLCEAKLGDPIQKLAGANYNAGVEALARGMESTHGMGSWGPARWMDAGVLHPSLKGVQMPDMSAAPGQISGSGGLHYSEYICYNVAQVRLRYLFRCEF